MDENDDDLKAWRLLTEQTQVEALTRRLIRELGQDHPLFGKPCVAIAVNNEDDVLYRIEQALFPFAIVHLTWTSNPPEKLPWPFVEDQNFTDRVVRYMGIA